MYQCENCKEIFSEEKIEFNYVGTYGGCETLASSPCCNAYYKEITKEEAYEIEINNT